MSRAKKFLQTLNESSMHINIVDVIRPTEQLMRKLADDVEINKEILGRASKGQSNLTPKDVKQLDKATKEKESILKVLKRYSKELNKFS